ncbi:MAG: polymerase, sigma-24 subunit, subfamily [Ilumatobacteraceae bacterium]|nr:polymerase, sigma-24 subunit, subfamily [Ilumatobacteraceae bacterium]
MGEQLGHSLSLDDMPSTDRDAESCDPLDAVVRAARHDDASVTRLFEEMQPRILRYLRAQEPRFADDIAAEMWVAVAGSIATFDGGWSQFRAWCFAIVRNRLADHRRTAARRRTDVVDAGGFDERAAPGTTEDVAIDSLSGQAAASLIASHLKPEHAEALLLRVLGDLDAEQVGKIMGRSPNWVRVSQHRALRTLAARLGTDQLVQP